MSELHIGYPFIEKKGDRVRLCSLIKYFEFEKVFYYEVGCEYEEYLCTDRSDAFLVSLLQFAMNKDLDITWEAPVTERLAYQIRTIFIPVISKKYHTIFHNIEIDGPETNKEFNKKQWAVGTGASGGVDSFYTILKHLKTKEASYNITHLLYVSISNHADSEEELRKDYYKDLNVIKSIASDLELPLIDLFSNESQFFFKGIVNWGALRFAGMVYALQNLFSAYYFSSGYPYEDITFGDGTENFDSLHFDLFTLMIASTRNLNFLGVGGEVTRGDKVKFIESNLTVKKYLNVCNYESGYNCSQCDKCLRTMSQLEADGCLDEFSEVFDLNKYNSLKQNFYRKMQYRKSVFDREILLDLEKNCSDFHKSKATIFVRPIYLLWQKMKNCALIMRIFYKFNLDYRLYGKAMAESIRYSKGIPLKIEK